MSVHLKRLEKKTFFQLVATMWQPHNPHFREKFNSVFREAIMDTTIAKDTGWITKLIRPIPCKKSKLDIITRVEASFPFRWNEKTESFKWTKSGAELAPCPKNVEKFSAIPPINTFPAQNEVEGAIVIEKSVVTKAEFVDFMLDTIILNRRAFSPEDLQQVEATLETIKKQILKKKGLVI